MRPLVSERVGVARSSRQHPNDGGENENEDESTEVADESGVTVTEVSKRIGVKTGFGYYSSKDSNKIRHDGLLS